jgi:hypothetical protein
MTTRLRWLRTFGSWVLSLVFGAQLLAQEQTVDPSFTPKVDTPAYQQNGPTIAIDEAHSNFHTAAGRYRPFAELLRSDGYTVIASASRFDADALSGIDVLVVANALPADQSDLSRSAFTERECDVVRDWVRGGGSLLLIADHVPFGAAAKDLASRFGVMLGTGITFERAGTQGVTTQLTFQRDDGSLGRHSILRGRGSAEEIRTIVTFTGQSMAVPNGATALMQFGASAREAATSEDLTAEISAARNSTSPEAFGTRSRSVDGSAQGVAMSFGRGRVVVLGEAGFVSAQVIRYPNGNEVRFGMNVAGNDNRQFVLNVLHWLSGLLM